MPSNYMERVTFYQTTKAIWHNIPGREEKEQDNIALHSPNSMVCRPRHLQANPPVVLWACDDAEMGDWKWGMGSWRETSWPLWGNAPHPEGLWENMQGTWRELWEIRGSLGTPHSLQGDREESVVGDCMHINLFLSRPHDAPLTCLHCYCCCQHSGNGNLLEGAWAGDFLTVSSHWSGSSHGRKSGPAGFTWCCAVHFVHVQAADAGRVNFNPWLARKHKHRCPYQCFEVHLSGCNCDCAHDMMGSRTFLCVFACMCVHIYIYML